MAGPARGSKSAPEIQELIAHAQGGGFGPVHLLVGPERFLIERAASALKKASLADGLAGFNDDLFHANHQSFSAQRVISAARTLPMMARSRFLLVRDIDEAPAAEIEALAGYVAAPVDSACLVLIAEKLDKRNKLYVAALKGGAVWEAQSLKAAALRRFAIDEAKRRGHALGSDAADALILAMGDDLAATDDAIERLSLFVGPAQKIEVDAVEACVTRIASDSIWALVDAVGMRDTQKALRATGTLLAAQEPPLRILAMVARQLRIVARMREALASGLPEKDAAMQAGAPPFKARELKESAKRFSARELTAAFSTLAETDLALKGSRRPPERVMEEAILALCAGRQRVRERIVRKPRTYR
jgi:DNA polymerase III subunit delta